MVFTKDIEIEQGADFNLELNWLIAKVQIKTITVGSPIVIETVTAHRLATGDKIIIRESNTYPNIQGNYTVTVIDNFSFSVTGSVTEVNPTLQYVEKEDTWLDPYYGFIGVPKNITNYSWSAKVANNYNNSAGINGVLGSVATGTNQVLLNISTNNININIEPGDFVTVAGSGITNATVRSVISNPTGTNAVLEVSSSATTTVTNAKISRIAGIIAQFVITANNDYGSIKLNLPASSTNLFPIEGDRKFYWDLFGTTVGGEKTKLVKGKVQINPSVL